jgi:hypothetical protein
MGSAIWLQSDLPGGVIVFGQSGFAGLRVACVVCGRYNPAYEHWMAVALVFRNCIFLRGDRG